MTIRMRMVFITKFLPYSPMPVGTNAITPAIPDAQKKPGEGSEGKSYQI